VRTYIAEPRSVGRRCWQDRPAGGHVCQSTAGAGQLGAALGAGAVVAWSAVLPTC
jgi:hypothetical protein